ncbi:hypothetical protein R1sor_018253 [Riccia sorocarpa]|uniref:Uncharacterized protein n=1 Tax=Riccia sorocarpa TaxID=122646 RepID=A0ABD3IA78_9MARC
MIPEEDIGTEEGELVDHDPPRPEAVVRSDKDKKRKQTAVEEGPLALALRPAADNRTEAQRNHAIKDERFRQNFPLQTSLVQMSKEFKDWTEEVVRVESEKQFIRVPRAAMKTEAEQAKWMNTAQIWMRWFASKKSITDFGSTSGKYKLCESLSDNTIRFISPQDTFTMMDETTRLGHGGMGFTHRVGIVDEELAEVLGHHEVVHYALKVMHRRAGDKKVHGKCICEMMAFPESHPAIIRPIGLRKDKKKPMLLFPIWNGGTIERCMNLEKSTRGRISPKGISLIDQKHRDNMTADEWLNIQIFRKHRLQYCQANSPMRLKGDSPT